MTSCYVTEITFSEIYSLGFTDVRWAKLGNVPKTVWIFGQSDDGKYIALNTKCGHSNNQKVVDTKQELLNLMDWFVSKDWQLIPMSVLMQQYKDDPYGLNKVVELLADYFPITTVAVLQLGDKVMNYYFHPIKGYMYGSSGPDYVIREDTPDVRIANRLNDGWTIVTDNR